MDKLWSMWGCWLLVLIHLSPPPTEAQSPKLEFSEQLTIFTINLYNRISYFEPKENIVFSPFSIQTCAAMARLGAKKETAEELDLGLRLSTDTHRMAESFHQAILTFEKSKNLQIANKIFVMQGYNLRQGFKRLLTNLFHSSVESLDFGKSERAAATINQWVKQKTNNSIPKIVEPSSLTSDSRIVLVNAIHFKGNWVHKFNVRLTRRENFYLNDEKGINVPMMNIDETFGYAELPELDATALQLPYKDSNLFMLIILPNSKTGLSQMENKLRAIELITITKKVYQTKVWVKLPRFKSEFQIELSNIFKTLGMTRIFSSSADFSGMLESPQSLKLSSIIHKAFIEVNEFGTEAAASTATDLVFTTSVVAPKPVHFHADHPFIYYIMNEDNYVLFAGKLFKV
ncbi:antichymotrypsin-2-like [Drosophila tropicalis]|uniref:antichymotrypsin-2-like n=1 Tax=Drosophila tropicalis TaxID=46794 RepID=UPI0035ABE917